MTNFDLLNIELKETGSKNQSFFEKALDPISTLLNSKVSAKPYKEILVKYLDILQGNELGMVIRALSEKGLVDVSSRLIKILFSKYNYPNLNLWVVGNAINIIDDKTTYNEVLKICQISELGISRQMMMTTLRKMKTEESFKVLINSLNDESIKGHAIDELGKWGDERALGPIENIKVRKGLFEEKAKKKAIEILKISASKF